MKLQAFAPALLLLGTVLPAAAAEPAPQENPKVLEALEKGTQRVESWEFSFALHDFKRAAKLAGGPCGPCFVGLARAHNGLGNRKEAAEAARSAIPLLTDRKEDLAQAYTELGVALSSDEPANLAEAEEAFREALEIGPRWPGAVRTNLAGVLWREKRYAESEQMARAVLEADPAGPAARNARIILCQARTDGAPIVPPEILYSETACPKDPLRMVEEKLGSRVTGEQVVPPRRLFGPSPQYDKQARKDRIEGEVVLESIIDVEGCIQQLRVCKALHPSLDNSALDAVRRWVFQPAELDGKQVKVYYTLAVKFTR